jgi:predicted transcriptional regulator
VSAAAGQGQIRVRLEVDPALPGGLAIYGANFGRYPLDPSLIFTMK